MAVRDIKTRLSIDGEKAFTKAVNEAGRNMRVLGSELKSAKASFDATGDEMDFLGSKSRILNAQIEQQKEIIRALKDAVDDSAKAYGKTSAVTDGFRIKLNNAEASLKKLEKELKETDEEALDLGRDSGRVGRQLEAGIGDAAEDAGDKVSRMVNELKSDLSSIGDSVSISAFVDFGRGITDVAGGIYDAVQSVTEGTEEYRSQMALLQMNAARTGYSPTFIKQLAGEIADLTGDMDGAVEGINNLMNIEGLGEERMSMLAWQLAGAALAWGGETIKFENVAEAIQESIAGKAPTGQYAEVLTRLGADMEEVTLSLEEAGKAGSDAVINAAMAWLGKDGVVDEAVQTYTDMNQALIDAREAQRLWNDELARTGEILQPVMTDITNFKTSVLGIFNDILSGSETIGEESADAFWASYNRKMQKDPEKEFTLFDYEEFFSPEPWMNIANYFGGVVSSVKERLPSIQQLREANEERIMSNQEEYLFYALGEEEYEKLKQQGTDAAETEMEAFEEALVEGGEDAAAAGETAGSNIMTGLADGLAKDGQQAVDTAAEYMDAIDRTLNRGAVYPSFYVPGFSGGGGLRRGVTEQTISLGLDGRTLASTSGSYYDTYLGLSASRTERYG